jgi:hypothetical protein
MSIFMKISFLTKKKHEYVTINGLPRTYKMQDVNSFNVFGQIQFFKIRKKAISRKGIHRSLQGFTLVGLG